MGLQGPGLAEAVAAGPGSESSVGLGVQGPYSLVPFVLYGPSSPPAPGVQQPKGGPCQLSEIRARLGQEVMGCCEVPLSVGWGGQPQGHDGCCRAPGQAQGLR